MPLINLPMPSVRKTNLLLATTSKNKIAEFKSILGKRWPFITLLDLDDQSEVLENGSSFYENALLKAQYYHNKYGFLTITDDSGLVISALNGEPGIKSKRYSGFGTAGNNQLVLAKMKNIKDRSAYFITTIVLYCSDQEHYCFEGRLNGSISTFAAGKNGFGYDSIFYMDDYHQTLAEVSEDAKNKISHRRMAINKLEVKLNEMVNSK